METLVDDGVDEELDDVVVVGVVEVVEVVPDE